MLIIPESLREKFADTEKWASSKGLMESFQAAMLRAHLYGCSWERPELAHFTLGYDFAPQSFTFVIEFLETENDVEPYYRHVLTGGLIFSDHDNKWSMHT